MKILFTLNAFPFDAIAGDRLYVYHLATELKSRHDVAICYRSATPERPDHGILEKEYNGIKLFEINHLHIGGPSIEIDTLFDNDLGESFRQVLEIFKPDVIHFNHSGAVLGLSIISTSYNENIPTIITLHNYGAICPYGTMLMPDDTLCSGPKSGLDCAMCKRLPSHNPEPGLLERIRIHGADAISSFNFRQWIYLLRRILSRINQKKRTEAHSGSKQIPSKEIMAHQQRNDAYLEALKNQISLAISPSYFLRDMHIKWGVPEEKIIYITYGMDHSPFVGFNKTGSSKIRFAYIGRLVWEKGVHILVEAFNLLPKSQTSLEIYGQTQSDYRTKEYYHYLKKISLSPNIKFMGPFDNRNVDIICKNIDVLIIPSLWYENSPLIIQEAALAGIPVIASNIGGMAELVINNGIGITFDRGNPSDLARKMELFLKNDNTNKQLKESPYLPTDVTEHAIEIEKIYKKLVGE